MSTCALTSAVMSETGGEAGVSCGDFGLDGSRPRRPFRLSVRTTSFTIPTARHFWNLKKEVLQGLPTCVPIMKTDRGREILLRVLRVLYLPAELAAIPSPLVHRARLVRQADVLGVLLHRPLEEPLAALAGADAVVLASRVVSADGTQQ